MTDTSKQEKEKTQPIRVFVRLRPLNKQEIQARSSTCVEISGTKDLLVKQQYGKHYTFDRIFGPTAKQVDIYETIVKPLIPELLAGYNCTVFAYGQTGTGKTYTISGGSVTTGIPLEGVQNEHAGIIPRSIAQLFDELSSVPQQYTVHVSFLELYNEEIFDLLSDHTENKNIRLFEDQHQKGSVIINGISTVMVWDKNQIYEILKQSQRKRQTFFTLLNDRSSRSHAIFSITIHTCATNVEGEQLVRTAKLNLVDLAGSEHIGKVKSNRDRRARETVSINQSLLTLNRVIKSLADKSVHIPYRESKLTRILQDSLGGRSKTSMIATVSLATSCLEETLNTLDYACRGKYITNRPEVNQRVSQKAWKTEYEKEMDRLRKDLQAARTGAGICMDQDNYERLLSNNEIYKEELSQKKTVISELEKQLQQIEEERILKEIEWNTMQRSFQEINKGFARCCRMFRQNEEQEELACDCEAKAEHLEKQAQYLLKMTEAAARNFHKKMHNLQTVNEENNNSLKLVSERVSINCQEVIDRLVDFMRKIKDTNRHIIEAIGDEHERQTHQCIITEGYGNNVLCEAKNIVNVASQSLENAIQHDHLQKMEFLEAIETKLKEVQNMTNWVDVKNSLQNTREELLVELNKIRKNANKQCKATSKIMNELQTVGKDMLEMQNSIKVMMEKVHGLETSVRSLTNINNECSHNINKAQTSVEQSLLGLCDKIQNNMDYRLALLTETIDRFNKGNTQGVAVVEVLEQLEKCKQNFPQINEQIETNPESSSVEVHVQNLIDITNAHLKINNDMFDKYITHNSDIQNNLRELNENASGNELVIQSTLQNCQKSLTDFINTSMIDIKTSDIISFHLQPQVNRKTQTTGDRNASDYLHLQKGSKKFENKLSSSTISSAYSGTGTDVAVQNAPRSYTCHCSQDNRCTKKK